MLESEGFWMRLVVVVDGHIYQPDAALRKLKEEQLPPC
jgi:hypothetical protein